MTIELHTTHLVEMAVSVNCLEISKYKILGIKCCCMQLEWKKVRYRHQIKRRESSIRKLTTNRLKCLGKNICVCSES